MTLPKLTTITSKLSVSGQIREEDLDILPTLGVDTIINNRPNDETCNQPSSETLALAANALGLDYHHIPVSPGKYDPDDAARMVGIINRAKGRVLAFCRTGNRSSQLFRLGQNAG